MRLLSLEADERRFRTLSFRPGLSVVLGDSQEQEGSSNGVGKTLALGLVHHCLGANADARLTRAVPDWVFRLRFRLADGEHRIERSGDGKRIHWDDEPLSLKALRSRLSHRGPFNLVNAPKGVTFRSLFSRFARYNRDDCLDPLRTKKEQEYDTLARVAFLLGLDTTLVETKNALKQGLDEIKARDRLVESNDTYISELLRMHQAPQVRMNSLSEQINELHARIGTLRIAPDYRAVEERADKLTQEMREIGQRIAVLNFQIDGIRSGLKRRPELTRQDLLTFYAGLENVFKPEALRHFSEIESFHEELHEKRRARLEREKLRLEDERRQLQATLSARGSERDRLLSKLQGTTALDEYTAMTTYLAELREEMASIKRFLDHRTHSAGKMRELKARMLEEDARATEYLDSEPIAGHDEAYRRITKRLFPDHDAGLVLEPNTGENKLRYSIRVEIQGHGSDGINAARVLCFDWLVLTRGANHDMGFLWHDGRLFADMDPRQRAAWFEFVIEELGLTEKSYIATLNSENFNSMREHLKPSTWTKLVEAVVLKLSGDDESQKLLGFQFEGR